MPPKRFFDNYQLLRNLIHLSENGNSRVVFVYPEGNKKIQQQAKDANGMVTENLRNYVIPLSWEKLLSNVEESTNNKNLKKQINDFREKYYITTI